MVRNVWFTRDSAKAMSAPTSVGRFTYGTSPGFSNGCRRALSAGWPPSSGPTLYSWTPAGPTAVTRANRGGRGPLPSRYATVAALGGRNSSTADGPASQTHAGDALRAPAAPVFSANQEATERTSSEESSPRVSAALVCANVSAGAPGDCLQATCGPGTPLVWLNPKPAREPAKTAPSATAAPNSAELTATVGNCSVLHVAPSGCPKA
mmetsp:Transcript_18026/g.35365  ORF Transcript_18026/g.35365 Transcript_18026/m.35365 type:complete len:208 (-) Transcript_18026:61-684(-)